MTTFSARRRRTARQWYEAQGFVRKDSYLHVFMDGGAEVRSAMSVQISGLFPVTAFAHYTGGDTSEIRKKFGRVHECIMLEKALP